METNMIPAMTSTQVHNYLTELGKVWTRQGTAMELGCWLGASSVALLQGLVQARYDKSFWAFDRWIADKSQIIKAKNQGVKLIEGQDLRTLYINNVSKIYPSIKSIKGGMPQSLQMYGGDRIEICIFDAPKKEPVFSGCINTLKQYWIPGVTVLGLLDYRFYDRHVGKQRKNLMAPVNFFEKYKTHFSILKEWDDEVVLFLKYEKIIT